MERNKRIANFALVVEAIAPMLHPLGVNGNLNPWNTVLASLALTDETLLEATLFHAAAHLDTAHGRSYSTVTLYHRGESVHLVNQRLDDPERAIHDNTVGAIAMMSGVGVSTLGFCGLAETDPTAHRMLRAT